MNTVDTKKGSKRGITVVAVVLIFAVIGYLGWSVWSSNKQRAELQAELDLQSATIAAMRDEQAQKETESFIHDSDPIITTNLVSSQINALQKLVTAEYAYTTAGKYENPKKITVIGQNINIPFTTKYFIVTYDGCIRVGVDLSMAKISIDDEKRIVTVTLPASEMISHETYEDTLVVLDETTNVFNPISISDYNDFVSKQNDRMLQKAIDAGIFTKASDEAKSLVESALSVLPGIGTDDGEYELIVK